MITAQIERPIEVNGVLSNAIAKAAEQGDQNAAFRSLVSCMARSNIYTVRVTEGVIEVFSRFHKHRLAYIAE